MPITHTLPRGYTAVVRSPLQVTFTSISAEAANRRRVIVQLRDSNRVPLSVRSSLYFYLANSSLGRIAGCGTSPTSGNIDALTNGRVIPLGLTTVAAPTKRFRAGIFTANTAGRCDIRIRTSRADTFYLTVVMPDGQLAISNSIAFA